MSTNDAPLNYHEARLLLLLSAFDKGIQGLTKLAKLDFLLRYPTMLERLMTSDGLTPSSDVAPSTEERLAVESPMIRYKYGPWDDLYYPLIGSLVGKGLADSARKGSTLRISLTPEGAEVAERLSADETWARPQARVAVLKRNYDRSGNSLKERIYRELPDVVDRPYRTAIDLGST